MNHSLSPEGRAALRNVSDTFPVEEGRDSFDMRRRAAGLLATMLLRIERDQTPNPAAAAKEARAHIKHMNEELIGGHWPAVRAMTDVIVTDPQYRREFGVA